MLSDAMQLVVHMDSGILYVVRDSVMRITPHAINRPCSTLLSSTHSLAGTCRCYNVL